MANPIKRLLGQTAIYGLSSIVGRFLNYLLVPLYLSVFERPAQYGVVSELYAYVAFLIVFLTFGLETTFFNFLQKDHDKEKVFQQALTANILINGLFAVFLFVFSQSIADAMLFGDHAEYIVIVGIVVMLDALSSLPLAKLRAENRPLKFATIQFSSIAINIVLNLFFLLVLFDPARPEEGVLFILIANLFSSLIKPAMLYKDYLNFRFQPNWDLLKEMLWYAFPLMIAGMAGIVNETLDRILLKQLLYEGTPQSLLLAEDQVGIYSANYKLAMLVTIFLQAYRYAAEPYFFSQAKDENRDRQYRKVMNIFVAVVATIFLVVTLNIEIFKGFITNEAYREGLKVVPILLLANVFLGIYINQSIWYKLSGQTKFGAYISIGGAFLTILVNVLFIPTYGYMASAWATLIVYAAQMIASYLLSRKYYPIHYNLRKFFFYLGLALVFFWIGKKIEFDSKWLYYGTRNGLILLYLTVVYWLERGSLSSSTKQP